MLGKLFKYEWKTISKMGLLMLAALGIVTLLGVLGFALPFSNLIEITESSDESVAGAFLSMLISMGTMMVYILTMMGVVYGMLIYMGVHFYKTMYSDEGYLTHTLPVTPRQLIFSKVLNGSIWYGIISIGMVISVGILVIAMMFSMGANIEFIAEMREVWKEILFELGANAGLEVVHIILSMVLMFTVTPIAAMMTLFGSITIGQLASKYRALMGILAYFGACMVNGMVSYIISFVISVASGIMAEAFGSSVSVAMGYDATIISSVIMAVVFYFISHAILTKKLNME